MKNKEEILRLIVELIFKHTVPKDQFGFYTEAMLIEDIRKIINEK